MIKPAPWNARRSMVAPDVRPFWDGLRVGIVYGFGQLHGTDATPAEAATPTEGIGPYGSAWRLNGTTQYVAAEGVRDLLTDPGDGLFTISGIFKLSDVVNATSLFHVRDVGTSDQILLSSTGGEVTLILRDAAGSRLKALTVGLDVIEQDVWHIVTGTMDKANGVARLWVDGVEYSLTHEDTGTGVAFGALSYDPLIGANNVSGTPGSFWDGDILGCWVHTRLMSPTEVVQFHSDPFRTMRLARTLLAPPATSPTRVIRAPANDFVKPAKWAFDRALVDPKWGWFWEKVTFVLPMWGSGSGDEVTDLTGNGHNIATLGSGWSWAENEYGVCLRGATGTSVIQNTAALGQAEPFAAVVVGSNFTDVSLTTRVLGNDDFIFCLETYNNTGNVGLSKVAMDDGGSSLPSPFGIPFVAGFTLGVDKYATLLSNGRWDVDTNNESLYGHSNTNMWIGSSSYFDGDLNAIYFFDNYELSVAEHQQLQTDPFGPIRQARQLPVEFITEGTAAIIAGLITLSVTVAATMVFTGGIPIAVLAHHYRMQQGVN